LCLTYGVVTNTIPMITMARKDSSSLGFLINHNAFVGILVETVIESLGQFFTQLPHKLQFTLLNIYCYRND